MALPRLFIMLALVLTAVVAVAPAASAGTTAECQAQLADLQAATLAQDDAFTNARDFNGAVAKLDAAALKLEQGKNADAVAKLVNFQSQLASLSTAAKPKLDAETAASLSGQAQGVIDCINAIEPA